MKLYKYYKKFLIYIYYSFIVKKHILKADTCQALKYEYNKNIFITQLIISTRIWVGEGMCFLVISTIKYWKAKLYFM